MKIALASARFINKNIEHNLGEIIKFMKLAKERDAELVCFGEAFLQGFDSLCWKYDIDKEMAVSTDSDVFELLCSKSKDIQIDLMIGFIERRNGKLYSSYALIERGVLSYIYRRISKGWKDYSITDEHYTEGPDALCFSYRNKKCVVALCGDMWDFPFKFKLDEDILFWPVYIDYSPESWTNGVEKEYALQAQLASKHTLLINSGCENGAFGGCFEFVEGKTLSYLPLGSEGIHIVQI